MTITALRKILLMAHDWRNQLSHQNWLKCRSLLVWIAVSWKGTETEKWGAIRLEVTQMNQPSKTAWLGTAPLRVRSPTCTLGGATVVSKVNSEL